MICMISWIRGTKTYSYPYGHVVLTDAPCIDVLTMKQKRKINVLHKGFNLPIVPSELADV